MLLPTTEQCPHTDAIDTLSARRAIEVMVNAQGAAIDAVSRVAREIESGAEIMARAIRAKKSLVYAAAGSSGLMALADACELPGTFGIPATSVQIHMAGGVPVNAHMPGATEDDTAAARVAVSNVQIDDAVIVLSASGTTPYAVAVAKSARDKGGKVIAIANNPRTALLDIADVAICLETPPETIAGSTRLGAATAQKAALNTMSSLMGVKLGHVYQGMMVNVIADNAKLAKRALAIVRQITGVSKDAAETALRQANGDTKQAILVAAGCPAQTAEHVLSNHNGDLQKSIQQFKN